MKKALLTLSLVTLASPAWAFGIPGLPSMSLVSPTLSLNFGQGQASASIVLLAPTKDPYTAHNLATIPLFGSYYAANYVGMDPLTAKADPSLMKAANNQFLSDFLFLAAGILIPTIANQYSPNREVMAASIGSGIAVGLGGVLFPRFTAYPAFFAQKAVEFNQHQYESFGYKPWFTLPPQVPTPHQTPTPKAHPPVSP